MIVIINQLFEVDQKLQAKAETVADRNFKRIYHELEILGYQVFNPIHRKYQETDTDVEATLTGNLKGTLHISRVLKPVIYQKSVNGDTELIQKGIVIVEAIS